MIQPNGNAAAEPHVPGAIGKSPVPKKVAIAVEGSHFLWKMVRRIVGVLVEVGRGRLDVNGAAELLGSSSGEPARLTAPPSGLFLEKVYYRGDRRDAELTPVTPLRG